MQAARFRAENHHGEQSIPELLLIAKIRVERDQDIEPARGSVEQGAILEVAPPHHLSRAHLVRVQFRRKAPRHARVEKNAHVDAPSGHAAVA